MKYRHFFVLILFVSLLNSCSGTDDPIPFDHSIQAVIDENLLVDYLNTHYLTADKEIATIQNNETPLMDQVIAQNVNYAAVNYKLYRYVEREGITENPTRYDSILVKYRGFLLDSTMFDSQQSFSNGSRSWIALTNVIEGWKLGFQNFKGGINTTTVNQPISFSDTGKGILFIPSGLAYRNIVKGNIPMNSPLIFHIELAQVVVDTDSDNDGIPNKFEDLNFDGDPNNDDTDGDRAANYLDPNDDNDDKLTKDEDTNNDGDPFNDDSDGDGIPNFLDSDS